jgi:hypothetical protein
MKTIAVVLALALPSVASCQGWSVESCSAALEHAYSSFSAREHASTAGDFNSDGEADYALLLDSVRDSHKSAVGVCLSKEPRPLLVTSPYASGKIFTKPRGTAYKDSETGKEGVYERDAISVGDGARAGASYILRVGVFARVIDRN